MVLVSLADMATQMLLAGVHPKVARERLGHSTITTTLDLYSHVTGVMPRPVSTLPFALH